MIIAAIAVCVATIAPSACNGRTADIVLFPPYTYSDNSLPITCLREALAWLVSPGNSQHIPTRDQQVRITCGRATSIHVQFGTI